MSPTAANIPHQPLQGDPLRLLPSLRRALIQANAENREPPLALAAQIGTVEQALMEVILPAASPLPAPLRVLARGMDDLYTLWFDHLAESEQPRAALAVLYQRLLLAMISHSAFPQNIWPQAIALHRRAGDGSILGAMLALSTVQAGSYTPRQIFALAQGLLVHGKRVALRDKPPPEPAQGWLWLDSGGRPAGTLSRTLRTLSTDQLLYFNCEDLARALDEDAAKVAMGQVLDWQPGLLPNTELASALRLAAGHWLAPLHRRHNRRRLASSLSVCLRLDQVWNALDSGQPPNETSDWLLLNESASGCALMHSTGSLGGIAAGQALGLWRPGTHWALGVVRWTRSENSAHMELGVEILSREAQPVRVAAEGQEPEPAFLLPGLPGQDLGEALLTAARNHTESGKEFVLLAEKNGQLRIGQCRRKDPRHRTAKIEVFSFERLTRDD